jgi:hypothetical protein
MKSCELMWSTEYHNGSLSPDLTEHWILAVLFCLLTEVHQLYGWGGDLNQYLQEKWNKILRMRMKQEQKFKIVTVKSFSYVKDE